MHKRFNPGLHSTLILTDAEYTSINSGYIATKYYADHLGCTKKDPVKAVWFNPANEREFIRFEQVDVGEAPYPMVVVVYNSKIGLRQDIFVTYDSAAERYGLKGNIVEHKSRLPKDFNWG